MTPGFYISFAHRIENDEKELLEHVQYEADEIIQSSFVPAVITIMQKLFESEKDYSELLELCRPWNGIHMKEINEEILRHLYEEYRRLIRIKKRLVE